MGGNVVADEVQNALLFWTHLVNIQSVKGQPEVRLREVIAFNDNIAFFALQPNKENSVGGTRHPLRAYNRGSSARWCLLFGLSHMRDNGGLATIRNRAA